ncbi:iron-sulfur cluster assembly scaffold protein [Parasphingopyxis sp. CP4]|uniref:iron-sulfur cluster assembly scaffold protein n=1 Tax=Parasphingopyxis sp. CP4 TaxID=2724527 RepID=UPI0015A4B48A|nr:iron-sulfur cluster assembly scaffold protein [Parasphingopyxis sp. CP4]QLC21146.1 iron-sulfur cluster assembly scaffold protein [Parasphingopyxis sp. CP4]
MAAPLYTADILRLATQIPHLDRLADPDASIERRSPVCGSRIVVDVETDDAGRVTALGQEVRACALGQASAALMGQHAIGKSAQELATARDALTLFLAGQSDDPGDWPGLEIFRAAIPHSARHASIRLPFEAIAMAVTQARIGA